MVEAVTQTGPVPSLDRPKRSMRKTITFDGSANNGAVNDTVTVFGLTGRVHVVGIWAVCTDSLVGASATLSLGVAGDVDAIVDVTTATDLDTNDPWGDASPTEVGYFDLPTAMIDFMLLQDIDVDVLVQNITGGTIVFDVEYIPLTGNGFLTGD